MAKVHINQNDKHRVILTETLPYEVPIPFLNEGLYFYHKNKKYKNHGGWGKLIDLLLEYDGNTKPYNYRISKNSKSKRLLSVPHPSIQLAISKLYSEYDLVISGLCRKSDASLRAPIKIASQYYDKDFAKNVDWLETAQEVEAEKEGFNGEINEELTYASSYFTYSKYNFLYKFYDSYEAHRIEKKYNYLTKFDISKCFHNIYVPILGWAVKTKDFAKKHHSAYSFESAFQNIMKKANHSESSGIIVGPEFSRVFAEIILQDLDVQIIERLKIDLNISFDQEYTFRRYIDDYFLYTKNSNLSKQIMYIFQDELEKYKLFINESKTYISECPFITDLTIAKMDCKELVDSFYNKIVCESDEEGRGTVFKFTRYPSVETNKFIKNLKKIVKSNNVNYESLTGYTLTKIRSRLMRNLKKVSSGENLDQDIVNIILFTIEVSFFIYSMDIRVRTTYIITQIIIFLNALSEKSIIEYKDQIRKKIYDESLLLLRKMKEAPHSIEKLNLLISIGTNIEDYPINKKMIFELFDLYEEHRVIKLKVGCEFGYFQAMVLAWFIEEDESYRDICIFLEGYIIDKLKNTINLQEDTECVCLFFDSIRCPYFSEDFKKTLLNFISDYVYKFHKLDVKNDKDEILSFIKSQEWFFSWDKSNLIKLLLKKELRSPY